MGEVDRANLMQVAADNPNKAIAFDGEFSNGSIKNQFGFVPNNWDGVILDFSYHKIISNY